MALRSLDVAMVMVAVVALGATCAAVGVAVRARGRPRRYCPGPRHRGGRLARVLRAWWRGGCGYDLIGAGMGLRTTGCDVRCPECGRQVQAERELLRSSWRVRALPLVAILWAMVAALSLGGERAVGEFLRALPSSSLVALERGLASRTPMVLRHELRRRLDAETLTPLEVLDAIPLLVGDLADDGVPGNCEQARNRLLRLGPWAWDELRMALTSRDGQQRRAAAEILVDGGASPTGDLLDAVIEGLVCGDGGARQDGLRPRWTRDIRFVAPHVDRCQARIDEALRSQDAWQRFGAAVIASHMPGRFEPELVVPPLVARLASNDVPSDAAWALDGLGRWGAAARPALLEAIGSQDRQQRLLAAMALVNSGAGPDVRLAALLVELLRSDALPRREFGDLTFAAYETGALWLFRHAEVTHAALRAGAGSNDPRQRAVCRMILRHSAWRVIRARLAAGWSKEHGSRSEASTVAQAGG